MGDAKTVGKRDFIQHTSKYLKFAENIGNLVITHQNHPRLRLTRIKKKSLEDLRGLISHVKVKEDINAPVFKGFDQW